MRGSSCRYPASLPIGRGPRDLRCPHAGAEGMGWDGCKGIATPVTGWIHWFRSANSCAEGGAALSLLGNSSTLPHTRCPRAASPMSNAAVAVLATVYAPTPTRLHRPRCGGHAVIRWRFRSKRIQHFAKPPPRARIGIHHYNPPVGMQGTCVKRRGKADIPAPTTIKSTSSSRV